METFDSKIKAKRKELAGFQAKLDSLKAEHGKDHPEFVKLQKMQDQEVQELDRVEREYLDYQNKLETDIRNAVDKAKADTLAESKKRCQGIVAAMDKHGGDREVQKLGMEALRNPDCSVTDFKLDLYYLLENRQKSKPTTPRAESGLGDGTSRPTEIDKLRAQLETEDDPKERRNLVKRIKALRNPKSQPQK